MAGRGNVDGEEGEPDDARGVHREPDELGLVERLGDLPGEDGVDRADDDEEDGVGEGDHVADIDGGLGGGSLKIGQKIIFISYQFKI